MSRRFLPVVLLLVASTWAPAVSAAADPNPDVGQWIESNLALTFNSLTQIDLAGHLDVREYTDSGYVYTAGDIRAAYAGANRYGRATGEAFVQDLERDLAGQVALVLGEAFPNAESRVITLTRIDRDSLAATGADEYEPPVRVLLGAQIQRSAASLGMQGYGQEAIDALFDAGAAVETTFSLATQAGYDATYVLHAPEGFAFHEPTEGTLSGDGRTLTVARDNSLGTTTISTGVTTLIRDTAARAPAAEDVATTVDVTLGELVPGMDALPVATQVRAEVRAIDVADSFPGALPASVRLPYVSADGIRALHAAGAITDTHLASGDAVLLESVRTRLAAFLDPATLEVAGGLVRSDLALGAALPYDGEPPIGFVADANGSYPLAGQDTGNLDVALQIGALVRFNLDLAASERGETTFVLHAPEGVVFAAAEGVLSDEGRTLTYEVPPATSEAAGIRANVGLRDPSVPAAVDTAVGPGAATLQKDAKLDVTVDIQDLDITLGKAIGGDMGNLHMDVTVLGDLGVFEVPADLKGQFGESLELDYLSSDAVRLLLREGLITEEDIDILEDELLEQVRTNLADALGGDVVVEGGLDRETLGAGLIGETTDGETPIVFRATTSLVKPLSGGAPAGQAAIALYTQTQSFRLPRVEGLDTAYTVILPKGLAVTGVEAADADVRTGESADGREQFTVSPQGEQTTATVSMAVTPTFVLIKFWPIVLLAGLVLLLLVGSPIALVVLRRRKKQA